LNRIMILKILGKNRVEQRKNRNRIKQSGVDFKE
jgi:hypothetical protein